MKDTAAPRGSWFARRQPDCQSEEVLMARCRRMCLTRRRFDGTFDRSIEWFPRDAKRFKALKRWCERRGYCVTPAPLDRKAIMKVGIMTSKYDTWINDKE